MIVHRYSDGSEGYEYQVGDEVIVDTTIQGGWFDIGPTHSDNCVVERVELNKDWRIATLFIRYSPDWGPAQCFRWMIKPKPKTKEAAGLCIE